MITAASSEWVLLGEVYHHVLKRAPSPERAMIDFTAAWRSEQLHLRAVIRIEHVSVSEMNITFNQEIPHNGWDEWDFERSFAIRLDSEYVAIVVARDDVLRHWPSQKPQTKQGTQWQRRRAVEALKELFPPDGVVPIEVPSGKLYQTVCNHLKHQSKDLGISLPSRPTILRAAGRTEKLPVQVVR